MRKVAAIPVKAFAPTIHGSIRYMYTSFLLTLHSSGAILKICLKMCINYSKPISTQCTILTSL